MSKPLAAPTASDVRALYRSNPDRMARLTPEAQATVAEGARGRVHPLVIKDFNKGRKAHRRYVLGATTAAKEARESARADLRAKGLAGQRGPLSKAAKAVLAQSKG